MAKYITGLTGDGEGDGLLPVFLQFFSKYIDTRYMAYSAIYDQSIMLSFCWREPNGKNFIIAIRYPTSRL